MSEQSKTDDGFLFAHLVRLNVNSSFLLTHDKKKGSVMAKMPKEKTAAYTEDEITEIATCVVGIFLQCLQKFGTIRKNQGIGTECEDFKVAIENYGAGKYRFIWHTKPQPVEEGDPE